MLDEWLHAQILVAGSRYGVKRHVTINCLSSILAAPQIFQYLAFSKYTEKRRNDETER